VLADGKGKEHHFLNAASYAHRPYGEAEDVPVAPNVMGAPHESKALSRGERALLPWFCAAGTNREKRQLC
jgi:hypothetical protein